MGGGKVGERKIERMIACGAKVAVVSRELTPQLKKQKDQGLFEHVKADYDAACLEGAFMVMGATNSDEVNRRISEDAAARGILANIADDPARGDFILPALVRQGDLQIAISTGGKSPALAKKLRHDLESSFGQEYEVFLHIIGKIRKRLASPEGHAGENKKIFTALVNSDLLCHIKEKDWRKVKECILNITGLDLEITDDRVEI